MQQSPTLSTIQQVIFPTERMLLKGITPEIVNHLFTSHPDAAIIDFLQIDNNEELEWERNRYSLGLSWYRATSIFFIMTDRQTGRRIGRIGYHTWAKEHARAEIGYHIYHEEDKGKGYMTEAMAAILQYGFEQMGLNRVEAFIGTQNTPSQKLVQRFGFVKEGTLRGHYCKSGVIEDSLCFGLLRSDYKSNAV